MKKVEDLPPLGESTFYILTSLMHSPKHGYAILKDVELLSDGTIRMAIGNLYVSLKRLLEQGLIERAGEREQPDGQRRKVYRLSVVGERFWNAQADRATRMANTAKP